MFLRRPCERRCRVFNSSCWPESEIAFSRVGSITSVPRILIINFLHAKYDEIKELEGIKEGRCIPKPPKRIGRHIWSHSLSPISTFKILTSDSWMELSISDRLSINDGDVRKRYWNLGMEKQIFNRKMPICDGNSLKNSHIFFSFVCFLSSVSAIAWSS